MPSGFNYTKMFYQFSGLELVMTQQEFMKSLEVALSWMHSVQERLKANDNTQGPRDALEVRLRETEVRYLTH